MPIQQYQPSDLQRQIQERGGRWKAGHTAVSDLSAEDKLRRLGADIPSLTELEAMATVERHAQAAAGAYPADFDWRNVNGQNYVTPIEDQGNCGSCVAFGVAAAVEGTFQVQRNNPNSGVDLSEAQLFYCYGAQEGANCSSGWYPDSAYKYVQTQGLTSDAYFDYTAGDQACNLQQGWEQALLYINGFHTTTDVSAMKDCIANVGPVTTCFVVYDDFFYYTGGIYTRTSDQVAGGHCVGVVGFNDDQGYWICKNSWGTGWGEQGFFRIAYGQCGIDGQMWLIDGIANTGWLNGCMILAAYASNRDSNAWVWIDQLNAWAELAQSSPEATLAMLDQLLASKAAGRPNNIHVTNDIIDTAYAL
jgi:C1A family cysteine protease